MKRENYVEKLTRLASYVFSNIFGIDGIHFWNAYRGGGGGECTGKRTRLVLPVLIKHLEYTGTSGIHRDTRDYVAISEQ
jgi:hypothetical protein